MTARTVIRFQYEQTETDIWLDTEAQPETARELLASHLTAFTTADIYELAAIGAHKLIAAGHSTAFLLDVDQIHYRPELVTIRLDDPGPGAIRVFIDHELFAS